MSAPRKRYAIGELARELGVTTRTIRYYEARGLLCPRRDGGRRVYGPRDRVRLTLILRGRRLGFSLQDVAEMLDLYAAPEGEAGQLRHVLGRIRQRRSELEVRRAEIEEVLQELGTLERRCAHSLAQEPENAHATRGRAR